MGNGLIEGRLPITHINALLPTLYFPYLTLQTAPYLALQRTCNNNPSVLLIMVYGAEFAQRCC